jgi:hypothetical protein
MPDTNYAIHVKNASGNIDAVVMRDPGVVPVDSGAAGQPRLNIPHLENNNDAIVVSATFTAATNATPIVVTATNTFSDNDLVEVTGAVGNTAANGTFEVTSTSGAGFTLVGSDGNGAWTSGGVARKISKTKSYGTAIQAALRAILNDRAAGN